MGSGRRTGVRRTAGARGMRLPEAIDTPLRTAAALVAAPAGVLVLAPAAIGLAAAGAEARRVHHPYLAFARWCLWVGGTRLHVAGAERVPPDRAFVVVSNHESNWDPVCILAGLPQLVIRFVAKREIMDLPLFGHALRRTGNVTVVRTHTAGDVERLRDAMAQRDPVVSLLFFPEGTRSPDGALHPFKMGAFTTALAAGLPILPLGVAGTYEIWRKGGGRLRRGDAALEVGEPIPVAGRAYEDRAALRDEAHAAVAALRGRARARLGMARGAAP